MDTENMQTPPVDSAKGIEIVPVDTRCFRWHPFYMQLFSKKNDDVERARPSFSFWYEGTLCHAEQIYTDMRFFAAAFWLKSHNVHGLEQGVHEAPPVKSNFDCLAEDLRQRGKIRIDEIALESTRGEDEIRVCYYRYRPHWSTFQEEGAYLQEEIYISWEQMIAEAIAHIQVSFDMHPDTYELPEELLWLFNELEKL